MTRLRRRYPERTVKVLWALSGNQCAHPECTESLIAPATPRSDELVIGHICHIYAASGNGPRAKPGLTQRELNHPSNLILLCRNHHGLVDGQHETYPADLLIRWKKTHESVMIQHRMSMASPRTSPDLLSHPYFPVSLVDHEIESQLSGLRKARFFEEFDRLSAASSLGDRLMHGELSGGSPSIRSRALAWCARTLVSADALDQAHDALVGASRLDDSPEVQIARSFLDSCNTEGLATLSALASINSPSSRSAALMIVCNKEGDTAALNWLDTTSMLASDLDPDGKLLLLRLQLSRSLWDDSTKTVATISEDDLSEAPALHHLVALSHLVGAVPSEFRQGVIHQPPFNAAAFPLASDATHLIGVSIAHFESASTAARLLLCQRASRTSMEYALWLRLRHHQTAEQARAELQEQLRLLDPPIRLVRLALQFGLALDLVAVEQEIDRQLALHGGPTQDTAIARLSLALARHAPLETCLYIDRHLSELSEHLDTIQLRSLQVETLAAASLPELARESLARMLSEAEGVSPEVQTRLEQVIQTAEASNPLEALSLRFQRSSSLSDLIALVGELETSSDWDRLSTYGRLLFDRTHSASDAERLCRALSNTYRSRDVCDFLLTNSHLLDQSPTLRLVYAWSLFQEGHVLDASSQLDSLPEERQNPNFRRLRIALAITTGDWNSLSEHLSREYQARDHRTARELLEAAQLAVNSGSPHARDLTRAAASAGEQCQETPYLSG